MVLLLVLSERCQSNLDCVGPESASSHCGDLLFGYCMQEEIGRDHRLNLWARLILAVRGMCGNDLPSMMSSSISADYFQLRMSTRVFLLQWLQSKSLLEASLRRAHLTLTRRSDDDVTQSTSKLLNTPGQLQ